MSENLLAAVQLAVSCSELYFARCCALRRTGTFASESKAMCLFYLILRSDVLMFRISDINQWVKNYFETEKSWIYQHVILVSRYLVFTGVNWSQHGYPMSKKYTANQGCLSLFWNMAATLGNSAVAVFVCTRPHAIPLSMITMRKSTHGFAFLSFMSMGLHLESLRAAGAPL